MAGYRQFHTKFWKDDWVIELEPMERYLFSYLFTNELSSISGIYKLPLRVIVNETGLEKDFIVASLKKFQEAKKIFYQDGVMWVVKMRSFHKNASPRTMTKVNNDIAEIPDCPVKTAYLYYQKTGIYNIDTISIQNSESVSVSVNKSVSASVSEIDTVSATAATDDFDAVEQINSSSDENQANIYSLYQGEIGLLTPMIADALGDAEKHYPPDWIPDAIREAATHNARSWKYVEAILKRWKEEGKKSLKPKAREEYSGPIILPDGQIRIVGKSP